MSADKVPGVATVSGAQPSQPLGKEAVAGAARLAAAVQKQKRAAARSREEALALMTSAATVAPWTASASRLSVFTAALDTRIDGQAHAKNVVARALRRRSLRLDDVERPLRMLFAGPSGVGKTVMATALCEALLGSCVTHRNFIRFNLSEYSHVSKFNRLTGGDPNYVGYKEGGELTNFVRQAEERRAKGLSRGPSHTSCVVLFDEVDRAAEGLLTYLMNFLDQGQLTDGKGEMIDASKAVVLMTTNVGRDAIAAARTSHGEADEAAPERAEALRATLVEQIRAEVLREVCDGRWENLGRLGFIVPFLPLEANGKAAVVRRQMELVARRAAAATPPVKVGCSVALEAHVAEQWDDDLGGRSTRDYIEERVVEALAEALDAAGEAKDADVNADQAGASALNPQAVRSVRATAEGAGKGAGKGGAGGRAEGAAEPELALQLDLMDQPPAAIVGAPRLLVGAAPRLVARPLRLGETATLGAAGAEQAEEADEEAEDAKVEFGWARK